MPVVINSNPHKSYLVGVDVGGTFTDLAMVDQASGHWWIQKVLTTPEEPATGILNGLARLVSDARVESSQLSRVVHATTLVGNAIIEHRFCRVGLLTTAGFRDVLTLAHESRYDIYESSLSLPIPPIPRRDRIEVRERLMANGSVVEPLTSEEAMLVAEQVSTRGFESVAIMLLHSYRNDAHEQALASAIRRECPDISISLSSEVLPQIGEYERACATSLNAAVQPLVQGYLAKLSQRLATFGIDVPIFLISSSGGLMGLATAARYPIRLLESGPVAGALGAAQYASSVGFGNVLSFEMGGTTAKACLILDGSPLIRGATEVARVARLTRGSGLPVAIPAADILEIGAGGGSIARADRLGLLTVGPDSAGAVPGPACYGRGGTHATVTDANLVLGYLNPNATLGGEVRLDLKAAETALSKLGSSLNISGVQVAWGIHQMVTERMATALRTHAIEEGVDWRRLPLIAFGGAGPTHAYGIASRLKIRTVTFPPAAGVFSAAGMLFAPQRFEAVRTSPIRLSDVLDEKAEAIFQSLERQLATLLGEAGADQAAIIYSRSITCRYVGQDLQLELSWPATSGAGITIADEFINTYEARYGWSLAQTPIEVLNWKCAASDGSSLVAPPPNTSISQPKSLESELRLVFLTERVGFERTAVFDRNSLIAGSEIAGPTLIESPECTILVGPGASARVEAGGSITMSLDI